MSTERRFMRFVYEFEVEVEDLIDGAVFRNDVLGDGEGNIVGMLAREEPEFEVASTLLRMTSDMFGPGGRRAGLKFVSGSMMPRYVDENGNYTEFTLPPVPGRNDGSLEMS
ncbi:hypothetical protein [Luteimicrobium album]|nr:hypothetical protein [Luteimicrobium album]